MKNAYLLDIPDLPERAFTRHGRNIRPQGGGKGSTPKQPDYMKLAQQDAQSNMDMAKYATQANRVNQFTPWGSLTWSDGRTFNQNAYDQAMDAWRSQGGSSAAARDTSPTAYQQAGMNNGTGLSYVDWVKQQQNSTGVNGGMPNPQDYYNGDGNNWTQTVSLSPEMQAIFDQSNKIQQGLFGAQNAALGRVNQTMGSGFDVGSLPQGGDASQLSIYDPNQATNNATDLLMQRLNPELDRQQEALRTQLANQGVMQGSQAYNQAMSSFGQQRNDAATQAALQGIGLGMQQQGQTYGQNLQKQNLANLLRGNSFQEQAYLRQLPLNELNALTSGTQVSMPQFQNYAQQATTGGANTLGAGQAGYQSALGAANARNASAQQQGSGLGSLAGAGLGFAFGGPIGGMLGSGVGGALGGMFSDRRLKTNIRKIGTADNGLSIYSYSYIWGGPSMIGYMADEVEKVAPHAVGDVGGLKTVDYARI